MRKLIKFTDCQIIEGYTRDMIYDLTRQDFYFSPKSMTTFVYSLHGKAYPLDQNNLKSFENEYFDFLIENEIIKDVSNSVFECFPEIDKSYLSPHVIHSLHISINQIEKFNSILNNQLMIPFIYIYGHITDIEFFKNVLLTLDLLQNSKVIYVEDEQLIEFDDKIHFIEKSESIKLKKSNINFDFFFEAQNFNTFFNKVLFINYNGEISLSNNELDKFVHIDDIKKFIDLISFANEIENIELQTSSKNKTDICKDCEFRYMCFDHRVPVKRNQNEWYHKTECNYNPYICKWVGDKGYLNLLECGVISNENGFIINKNRISKINKEIWGYEE